MMLGPSMGSERMSLPERAYRRLDASMRARVLVPTALLFALTLAAMVAAAVHFYGSDMERGRQERAEIFAGMVASGVSNVMLSGQPREVATFLDALGRERSGPFRQFLPGEVHTVVCIQPGRGRQFGSVLPGFPIGTLLFRGFAAYSWRLQPCVAAFRVGTSCRW